METNVYMVYVLTEHGELLTQRFYCVGMDNVNKIADELKRQYPLHVVHYNKADTCMDGYLVQGDYLGKL